MRCFPPACLQPYEQQYQFPALLLQTLPCVPHKIRTHNVHDGFNKANTSILSIRNVFTKPFPIKQYSAIKRIFPQPMSINHTSRPSHCESQPQTADWSHCQQPWVWRGAQHALEESTRCTCSCPAHPKSDNLLVHSSVLLLNTTIIHSTLQESVAACQTNHVAAGAETLLPHSIVCILLSGDCQHSASLEPRVSGPDLHTTQITGLTHASVWQAKDTADADSSWSKSFVWRQWSPDQFNIFLEPDFRMLQCT